MRKELALLQSFLVGHKYAAGNELTLADFSILGTLTLFEVTVQRVLPHSLREMKLISACFAFISVKIWVALLCCRSWMDIADFFSRIV